MSMQAKYQVSISWIQLLYLTYRLVWGGDHRHTPHNSRSIIIQGKKDYILQMSKLKIELKSKVAYYQNSDRAGTENYFLVTKFYAISTHLFNGTNTGSRGN